MIIYVWFWIQIVKDFILSELKFDPPKIHQLGKKSGCLLSTFLLRTVTFLERFTNQDIQQPLKVGSQRLTVSPGFLGWHKCLVGKFYNMFTN
jgi:hypothetical protein